MSDEKTGTTFANGIAMEVPPEAADLIALMRYSIREDAAGVWDLLMKCRLDPYFTLAMAIGRAIRYGKELYGSEEELDRVLAEELAGGAGRVDDAT